MNTQTNPIGVAGTTAASIIVLIKAVVALLTAMGILKWDTATEAAFNAVVVALLDVATILIALFWAGRQTTPLAEPKAKDGERLVRASGSMRSASAPKDKAA